MSFETRHYFIHGLVVRSAIPMHGLRTSAETGPNVIVEEPRRVTEVQPLNDYSVSVLRTAWCEIDRQTENDANASGEAGYLMRYPLHGFAFHFRATSPCIRIQPIILGGEWTQMLPVMASGAVLAFACRLLGMPALHANTVRLHDQTVAFAGESGAGKTLTSSLALLNGAEMVTDDVTVVTGDRLVHPGLLEVRLRVDDPLGQVVGELLSGLPHVVVARTPDDRMAFTFQQSARVSPALLTRIVIPCLDQQLDRFVLERLSVSDSLMELLKANRLIGWTDRALQRSDFLFVASLTETVAIDRLRMPSIAADGSSVIDAAHQIGALLEQSATAIAPG
jgi:hypothetical protein